MRESQGIKCYPLVDGASGCRANDKDGFRVFSPPQRLAAGEVAALTVTDGEFIAQYH